MEIFKTRFQDTPPPFQALIHIQTKTRWAETEASIGECEAGSGHLQDANQYLAAWPNAPWAETISASLPKTEELVSECAAR